MYVAAESPNMESAEQVTTPATSLLDLKNPKLLVTSGLINGRDVNGNQGKAFPVIEPSSATVLAHCADLSKEHIILAIEAAGKGYVTYYKGTTAREQGLLLKKFYQLILDNADDCKLNTLFSFSPLSFS